MDKLDLPEPTNDPQLNPIEHDCADRDRALAGRVGRAVGKLENLEEAVASLRRSVGRAVGELEKEREAVNRDRRFVMSELARGFNRIRDLENGMTDLVELGFLDRRDDRQPDPAETPGRRRDDRSSIPPDAGPVPGAQTLRPDPEKPNPRKVELPDPTNQPQLDPWKHRSKGMRCATCMFFVPKTPDPSRAPPRRERQGQIGRCRRHAPTMKGYPAVFETDWCGEHKLDENKL